MIRKRRRELNADLTPLIDVVFLLLIFFLVSSVFKKEELALLLNLPKTDNFEESVNKKELMIEIDSNAVALNGKEMSLEILDDELVAFPNKKIPVNVKVDQNVRYGRIIKIFDLLQKHSLTNLMLISRNNQ